MTRLGFRLSLSSRPSVLGGVRRNDFEERPVGTPEDTRKTVLSPYTRGTHQCRTSPNSKQGRTGGPRVLLVGFFRSVFDPHELLGRTFDGPQKRQYRKTSFVNVSRWVQVPLPEIWGSPLSSSQLYHNILSYILANNTSSGNFYVVRCPETSLSGTPRVSLFESPKVFLWYPPRLYRPTMTVYDSPSTNAQSHSTYPSRTRGSCRIPSP